MPIKPLWRNFPNLVIFQVAGDGGISPRHWSGMPQEGFYGNLAHIPKSRSARLGNVDDDI